MYIAEYMTRNPVTISPESYIHEARALMEKHTFRHLPVVDDEDVLVGIVTDRDLRSAYPSTVAQNEQLAKLKQQIEHTRISEIMVRECVFIHEDDTLDDSLHLFDKWRIGALPVIDRKRKIQGMFSMRDLTGAYKKLFGMAEKGSVLIALEDEGSGNSMSQLVLLLEAHDIPFTRLLRIPCTEDGKGKIFLRVNTFNVSKVHKLLENAGFIFLKPKQS